jgi:hypothetical protein
VLRSFFVHKYSFAKGKFFRIAGLLPPAGLSRPSGHLSARSVSFQKHVDFYTEQKGTASGRLPSVCFHLLSRSHCD